MDDRFGIHQRTGQRIAAWFHRGIGACQHGMRMSGAAGGKDAGRQARGAYRDGHFARRMLARKIGAGCRFRRRLRRHGCRCHGRFSPSRNCRRCPAPETPPVHRSGARPWRARCLLARWPGLAGRSVPRRPARRRYRRSPARCRSRACIARRPGGCCGSRSPAAMPLRRAATGVPRGPAPTSPPPPRSSRARRPVLLSSRSLPNSGCRSRKGLRP